jgi:hypothetical protein
LSQKFLPGEKTDDPMKSECQGTVAAEGGRPSAEKSAAEFGRPLVGITKF